MNIEFILQNILILWLNQSHTTSKCLIKILAHSSFFVFIFVVQTSTTWLPSVSLFSLTV